MKKRTSVFVGIFAFLVLILADQVSKLLAIEHLAGTSGIRLIPGVFELYYLENHGAAFGILKDRQWVFILVAVLMTIFVAYVYLKLPLKSYYYPLHAVSVLIGSGAIGNMLDRLFYGYVVDFLYVSLIDFPVFNVADCYVCVGAAITILLLFTCYKEEEFEFLYRRNS